ncbi:ubiquinone biosynthesis regulatory protein kinase UbiB [Kistimonas asteriae]|uniref:ubiquinone biosynthesis regulatory protein kinase UbiB n=1 Tax=Kistimonas asteriae TaxID=517724 RepID=UPI001BAB3CD3
MQQVFRFIKIVSVVARYRLDNLVDSEPLPFYIRWFLKLLPWRFIPSRLSRGERLRRALIELGPIFVKFGQILSTRRDLLPNDIGDELAKLQDRVPPFPGEAAETIIQKSLGRPPSELFATFNREPMASASVAQVHEATLHSGESVVVKVIRPGIEKTIRQDMSLLFLLAHILVRISSDGRRLRPVEVVADYEKTIFDELNLQREAANASQLRRNFLGSPSLYIPRVYWDYCSQKVMVMERIYGVPVTDLAALEAQGTNMKKLAERGVEVFFTQVFRDSFFHADMHPGNIFVSYEHPEDPQYIGVDCGIVGSLTPEDLSYLARNLLAFFHRDYRMVAQLHIDSGWVPRETVVNELEAAIRTVCEPIFEKPLAEISFGQVLMNLFSTARRFNMEVQPQLVLLQKTLLNIEGLGRQLYPQLDLWATAQPFLEQWMKDRVAPKGVLRRINEQMPQLIEQAPMVAHQVVRDLHEMRGQQERMLKQGGMPSHDGWSRALGVGLLVLAITAWIQPGWLAAIGWEPLLLGGAGIYLLKPGSRRER